MKKIRNKLVINHQLMSLKSQNITRNKKIQEIEHPEDLIKEIKIEAKEAED